MDITFAQATSPGPVREKNEDFLGSCLPTDSAEKRGRGSLLMIADGVAGSGRGGEASRIAVEAGIAAFKEARLQTQPRAVLSQMFSAANLAVYDAGMKNRELGRGATTLTAAILRHDEATLGHVGDCRAYLLEGTALRRLTSDHSYAGLQVTMGIISEEESMKSKSRYQLTRSLGQDPFVKVDLMSTQVAAGNFLVLCSDGLHGSVTEGEIVNAILRKSPEDACRTLVGLAEKRGSEDNISIQIARIDRIERVAYYHGMPFYPKESPGSSTAPSDVGKVLDDRFELSAALSEGGMATVYRALDRSNGQTVAIKIPLMRFESDPVAFGRFEREERIGRTLDHPSILKIIPVEKKSRPYMVMDFLEGQTLSELLAQVKPLPVQDAVSIASRLCEALEYLHERGIVHRDLKPQNVMVCNDGSLRIMDFGIAKTPEEHSLPAAFASTMGTPDYMAPEQVRNQAGDERTDIYSLGAMLYEMVTGSTPYQGDNAFVVMNSRLSGDPVAPSKLRPDIPPVVEEVILHAMERDPASRHQSATAFKSDLDHQDLVTVTGRARNLKTPKLWKTHWRRVRTAVIAIAILLGIFGFIYLSSHIKKGTPRPRSWRGRG
jgi:serine/threonine protein phosphatase PrpC